MKNILAAVAIAVIAFTAASLAGQTLTVTIKQVSIRADKQFYAKAVAEAKYQDKLEVVKQQGDWYLVNFSGAQGWVHNSSVGSAGATAPSASSAQASAKVSDEDVALAGKGFNAQVEGDYKKKNPNLNFAAVDGMEKISVTDKDAEAFMKDGRLSPREVKK